MYYKCMVFFMVNSLVLLAYASEASGSKEKKDKPEEVAVDIYKSGAEEVVVAIHKSGADLKKATLESLARELDSLYGDDKWPARWAKIKQRIEEGTVHPDEIRYGSYGLAQSKKDRWPLFEAVSYQDTDVVKFLLEHKARADVQLGLHGSLLFLTEKTAIAQLLLDHKADIQIRNPHKWHESLLEYVTALCAHEPELIPLYIKYGANPHIVDAQGNTLLHVLIEDCPLTTDNLEKCKQKARYLIAARAPVDVRSSAEGSRGKTVIELLQHKIEHAGTAEKKQQNMALLQAIQEALIGRTGSASAAT